VRCRGKGEREGKGRSSDRGRSWWCREGGRPMGRLNYTPTEIDHMLESVREYLPISGLEWELVAQRHMTFHPDQERMGDQLKKKFNRRFRMEKQREEHHMQLQMQQQFMSTMMMMLSGRNMFSVNPPHR